MSRKALIPNIFFKLITLSQNLCVSCCYTLYSHATSHVIFKNMLSTHQFKPELFSSHRYKCLPIKKTQALDIFLRNIFHVSFTNIHLPAWNVPL